MFTRIEIREIKRLGFATRGIDELNALLSGKVCAPQLFQHADPLEGPIGLGHQRFADVRPGKASFLQHAHATAELGQHGRNSGAGRPPAHDHAVE